MITGSMDFKACVQPNYDQDMSQNQEKTQSDYYLHLLHNTGVKIIDVNRMPAYRLNS